MIKGLALCLVLALCGFALAGTPGIAALGVSPLVFALLLGLVVGNMPIRERIGTVQPGLSFSAKRLLRAGIVLFGLSLSVQQIADLGFIVVALDLLVITGVLAFGYWMGTRVLRLDHETALLTTAGSAICGAAAVLATEATIRARPAATAMAVSTVVLFGTLAMLIYPLLFPITAMTQSTYGIYIGATVHEVAQVVAAADAVGHEALANAVIVKLIRVMLLVPFLLVVGQWWLRRQRLAGADASNATTALPVPWFAFGFLAMVLVNSFVPLPAALHHGLVEGGQWALAMAMGALGFETRFERLRQLGVRPLILAATIFALLMSGGLVLTQLLVG